MIFQDPYASLPRKRVGQIVSDPFQNHRRGTREETRRRVRTCSRSSVSRRYHFNRYPHEFSGGQRQRRVGEPGCVALSPS